MRLLRFSIRLGVSRTHRDVAEAHRLQHPADAAFVQEHKESLQNTPPEIRQTPTHHTIFFEARALADPSRKLFFLRRVQLRFRTTRMRLVRQAGHTVFIVAMHPVTQRLPIHSGRAGRIRSAEPFHDHRQRQKPAGNLCISLTRGQRTQTRRVMLRPGDRYRHRLAPSSERSDRIVPRRAGSRENMSRHEGRLVLDSDRCPIPGADGADAIWIAHQPVPGIGAGGDDLLIGVPDAGGQLVAAEIRPDILH